MSAVYDLPSYASNPDHIDVFTSLHRAGRPVTAESVAELAWGHPDRPRALAVLSDLIYAQAVIPVTFADGMTAYRVR